MNLQNKIIQRYRLFYPQETLREVSARTGIQITRVYRLLNGKPMKVGELEAFENVISQKMTEHPHFSRLNLSVEEASFILTNDDLGKIADYIERKVHNKKYQQKYISLSMKDISIA